MGETMAQMHQKHIGDTPYWYVAIMAVDPSAQGQKLTSLLMRMVNRIADEEKMDCYLDTVGEKNVTVYGRYGYTERTDYTIEDPSNQEVALTLSMLRRKWKNNQGGQESYGGA